MTTNFPQSRISINEAGFWASVSTVVALSTAEWIYASSDAPDWQGYEALYEGSADWLTPNGMAPLFVGFLGAARWIFGSEGYGLFRLFLFVMFAGCAGWLAYIMPTQRRLGGASAMIAGGAVIAALLLKSVVQIREGLAFVVALLSIVTMLRGGTARKFRLGISAVVAPLLHVGVASLSGVWLVAWLFSWIPQDRLSSRRLHQVVGIGALAAGVCLALATIENGNIVGAYFSDLGVETSAVEQHGTIKIVYWTILGLVAFVLSRQLQNVEKKIDLSFSIALGMAFIPFAYGFCSCLVVGRFVIPAVTSMGIRVLFTALDCALIIICLRGRANWLTVGAMSFMLADELRLLATA
jgi:hypothetical protein